ncbi:MAG TPA: aspartate aminotransferase family protein [Geobacteraceae bacterium]|nr:aspartate aminotransferase family protein [Geobacteraceae bacterium]
MNTQQEIINIYANSFTPALHVYWPVAITRGEGVYVEATDGRRYMDFSSGLAVLNIGHCHPRVVDAARGQLERYIHSGGVYYSGTTAEAAERLVSVTPPGLDMIFFSNSGAEAVEGSLKLARFVTGRPGIVAFTGGFHGRTLGALSVTTSTARYRSRYQPLLPAVYHAPSPYCFRCPGGYRADACETACFDNLLELFGRQILPEEVAACIIEPVLGEGGYAPASPIFLKKLRKLCDEHGILLIFDEVQSGMGRTSRWFAADHYGIVPDIMAVAKGIASGFPLSAVVSRKEIMERWPPGAHGTTFGGNPVSCAASLATIAVIEEERLLERSQTLAESAMARLRTLAERTPAIGDVRGLGLMIGIELVNDNGLPDGDSCLKLLNFCLDRGLILINCGAERNIIRFIPPLNVGEAELDKALAILEEGAATLS